MQESVETFAEGLFGSDDIDNEAASILVAETILLHRKWLLSKIEKK